MKQRRLVVGQVLNSGWIFGGRMGETYERFIEVRKGIPGTTELCLACALAERVSAWCGNTEVNWRAPFSDVNHVQDTIAGGPSHPSQVLSDDENSTIRNIEHRC